jgi:hypothetical protein
LALVELTAQQAIPAPELLVLILVLAHMVLLLLAAVMAATEMEMEVLAVPAVGQAVHQAQGLLVHQAKVMRAVKVLIIQFRWVFQVWRGAVAVLVLLAQMELQ